MRREKSPEPAEAAHASPLTPHPLLSWFPVWRRNFLVWKKLAIPSLLGNLADPMLYMLGLGYGLGGLLPAVDGVPYLTFLAAGTLAYSVMNSATFETLYSAFSRMHVQKTWDAILNTPLDLQDILLGELFWATAKSLLSGVAILLVVWALGLYTEFILTFALLPVAVLTGFCFAGLGLTVNAVSPNYDFFLYYFTLAITPMILLGGVFYPPTALPGWLAAIAAWLPLTHAIDMARPLLLGKAPENLLMHVLALLAYGTAGFAAALKLTRRRLLR
ncbi:MAG TPA: ABC transporter permease [Thiobacillaceae bacterium]|nr:ABC transporter permease [Thiobacillaceae bacterium]HNA83443.1 ABC transporter permease [Thiobacillaceae bacterium]HNI08866.1 ABC transporter permease [Thiobacillaceae bacterium]